MADSDTPNTINELSAELRGKFRRSAETILDIKGDDGRRERVWRALRRLEWDHLKMIAWAEDHKGDLMLGVRRFPSEISISFCQAAQNAWAAEGECLVELYPSWSDHSGEALFLVP